MKVRRSTKCSLKFVTGAKRGQLALVLAEYGRAVNLFIDMFWEKPAIKACLFKDIVDIPETWLTSRFRKVAAREALDLIASCRRRDDEEAIKPKHFGTSMSVSCTIASLQNNKNSSFDYWLHLSSMGNSIVLDIPIRAHRHFNALLARGRRLNSYVINKDYVQFCFEVETGPKKDVRNVLGIDTGITTLAALSNGKTLGRDINGLRARIRRCQHGSKGQKKATRALKQRIDEVAKEVVSQTDLVVLEQLKNITKNTKDPKRRLGKNIRRSIGKWQVRYWQDRVKMKSEDNRVSFRTVSAYNTSIICNSCGHTDRRNRLGEAFLCLRCGHGDNADVNASRNIRDRFLTGPYGACCKPKLVWNERSSDWGRCR